jgi:ABC-type multidrug transport system ATPase subunit|tara:strand:- start:181 stop:2463 length:2283 start_codon:yes stop_codon:yes gene_type:complete
MNKLDYKLYFYQNNLLFKKVAVEKGYFFSLVVGKGPEANVKLENDRISRNHLQLVYNTEGSLHVTDLGSTNGTFLNGFKLNPGEDKLLKPKDKLQLAGVNGILILIERARKDIVSSDQTDIFDKLRSKKQVTIGRNSDCDIVLDSETVSRYHATIRDIGNGIFTIKDLGSRNGTFINGKKVKGVVKISLSDKIYIGRHQLSLKGKAKDLSEELAITAIGIEKTYSNGVKALKKMDLSIPSKSLLAVMGPSGCGKSTLLKALNGDTPATKGRVLLFGQELLSNYDYLKTQIGYVPQDDIVHQQLTVEQCMYFTAKIRLDNPLDSKIDKKINAILSDLNISHIKHNLISEISGGQRKRVSIAVELLTEPLILFLDEPTSPLDPQTVEDFLIILKKLSDKGTTVVMVTHKPEDLEYMDEVIFMAEGGNITYYGDSKKYKQYFKVDTAVAVFAQISGKTANNWISKYLNPRPLSITTSQPIDVKSNSNTSALDQYYWLTRRYFRIKTNDTINSTIMLIQAPIIAVLICFIFNEISSGVLFMIAISAIWLGTQNAAREIVSEQAIYKRERMFNLDIFPYLLSKITVLSSFSIIQSFLFVLILSVGYSDNMLDLNDPLRIFVWMSFLSIASTFLGLLLSSIVDTTEKAMTIVPLILIPQIMLAGLIAKVSSPLVEILSYFTLSRWGVEGLNDIQNRVVVESEICNLPPTSMEAIPILLKRFHDEIYEDLFSKAGSIELDTYVITFMIIIMLLFIYRTLKKKDSVTL